MLELNKEYTYSQICEMVGWKISAGDQKKAQIKEIEAAFEFYHPINKKTHKEKKSYIFTKQLREINEIKHGGVRNKKAIQPMLDFLAMMSKNEILNGDGIYRSITTWLCDEMGLMNRETYNIPYLEQSKIESYCKKYQISNTTLFCDYVSTAKTIMKRLFLRALETMRKLDYVEYEDGFMFTYQLGDISLGHFSTDELNDIIKINETIICDEMNDKYKLSSKMSGRQLLLMIYRIEKYTDEFNKMKTERLMEDQRAVNIMNANIDYILSDVGDYCGRTYIDKEHPLLGYYRGIAINSIDNEMECKQGCEIGLSNAVRIKARQAILNKHYKNKHTGCMVYPYDKFECATDIVVIEKLLFKFYDENLVDDTALDLVEIDDEMKELFREETDVWGEPNPFVETA